MWRIALPALLALALCAGCGSSAPQARLTAAPRASLVDAHVRVRLTGAKHGEHVTITAAEGGWHAHATFAADAHGVVDVGRDRPVSGSYRGRDVMGIFWSMRAPGAAARGWPGSGGTIRLAARAGGTQIAGTSIVRRLTAPGERVRRMTIARDGFVGRFYAPVRSDGVPVLIFGGSEGGLMVTEPPLLAAHGHPTLSLAYFGEPGLPQSLVRIPLEYFVRAIRWLDRQPGADPRRLTVSGVSRGSEAALLLAADFPRLVHAVVALAPSSLVNPGLPRDRSHEVAAWTLGGKPIPFPSVIPVEKIRGPVFLAAGAADALWPSYSYEQQIVQRLHAHGRNDVTALSYAGAGHDVGFAVPNVPLSTIQQTRYGMLDLGGSRPADARARANLWPKLLRFLGSVRPAGRG